MTATGDATPSPTERDRVDMVVDALLVEIVGLDAATLQSLEENSELFGAMPEFDSMAVAQFLTALEERLGVLVEDDDVEAEDFLTYGRLIAFAERLALG
ncbi:acyl carrier protein [Sphingomicrobium sp. XHP0235]|uniref:acyl carrier protein n=1 Tax=Sphingomicrobium aquimarinum TaxID=3133971 RepID=UPI0031FE6284